MELELIAGDIDIDSKKLNAILDYLIKLGLLVKQGDLISSPMLNDLKNILNDMRQKDRGRKTNLLENPTKENAIKENKVIQLENGVFQSENTQSKVNKSKVNKRKENEIKEKGSKENLPPVFLNNFSFSENKIMENDMSIDKTTIPTGKEKSCAKKEIAICKTLFENFAPQYVWESKDNEQLQVLINKIKITKQDIQNYVSSTITELDFRL